MDNGTQSPQPPTIEPSEVPKPDQASSEPPPTSRFPKYLLFGHTPKEAIESAAKLTIAISALAYAVGLLIVNVHLNRFGISNFGLGQVQYVMTGFVWLVITGTAYLPVFSLTTILKSTRFKNGLALAPRIVFAVMFALAAGFLSIQLTAFMSERRFYDWSRTYLIAALTPLVSSTFSFFVFSGDARLRRKHSHVKEFDVRLLRLIPTLFVAPLHLMLVCLYALSVYPTLSTAFSGGKPQLVMLVTKVDQSDIFKSFNFPTDIITRRVGPVTMAFETDDFVLLLPTANSPAASLSQLKAPFRIPTTDFFSNEVSETTAVQVRLRSIRIRKDLIDSILTFTEVK